MKRRRIVRLQIFLLVAVAALLVWRVGRGPAAPSGLVAMVDIEHGRVMARAFELDTDTELVVDVVGSLEAEESNVPAAYGWILRTDTRDLVWYQDPANAKIDHTLMSTSETIQLPAGAYEAYFASFGSSERSRSGRTVLGLRRHWTNDSRNWHMVINSPGGGGRKTSFKTEGWDEDAIWSTGPLGNRRSKSMRIRVEEPSNVRIYSVGEICVRECDVARITRLDGEDLVWEMTVENSQHAGGLDRNRVFDGTVMLEEGLYEVYFKTDGAHAARSWRANPPFDPLAWGMRIWADPEKVHEFDPWLGPEPVVSFREVTNDANIEAILDVRREVSVVVVATGEVGSGDTVYDYAWLEREGDADRMWEMTVDASEAAGGDRTNRVETVFLDLEPGQYKLRYVSDGSHAFGDWRRREPDVPARWGVTMLPLGFAASDTSAIRVVSSGNRTPSVIADEEHAAADLGPLPDDEALLFSAVELGNEEEREGQITLETKTTVRIIAVGEISEGGQYDYGWIKSSNGSTVWEMTRRNTRPAGGNDINRAFDGILELEPDQYTVRFQTDFSHAYGDFGGGDPRVPSAWGIRIYRISTDVEGG